MSPRVRSVCVGIPSWNGRQHLEPCLAALRKQLDPGVPWTIAVLDNGSTDGTIPWLALEHPTVRCVALERNVGFALAANRLVEQADADAVVLLNNDTRPAEGWLAALVDALASAPADVVAVSGLIVDWQGTRLDCAEGILTFDGHALQRDQGRPLASAHVPDAGSELLFPSGGNMIVDRTAFLEVGGFDAGYFAYLEDVDLGWRLWARGKRVLFTPDALVHHRSGATSERLGLAKRGFLFERNAFRTVHRNYDDATWSRMMPAVMLTLCSRVQTLMVQANPGGELLTLDPYATRDAPPDREPDLSSRGGLPSMTRLAAIAQREGVRGLARKTVEKLRVETARLLAKSHAPQGDGPQLTDPRTVAHLQAVTQILSGLDLDEQARRATQAARTVSDREIFERFPLHVIPTYPGDERLFASPGFRVWLPEDVPLVHARLDEVKDPHG